MRNLRRSTTSAGRARWRTERLVELVRTVSPFSIANGIYSLGTLLVFIAITRIESVDAAGRFVICLGVTAPLFQVLTTGQLLTQLARRDSRVRLASEVAARLLSGVLASAVSVLIVLIWFPGISFALVLAVAFGRMVDAFADAPYAEYQRKLQGSRLLASMVLRNGIAVGTVVGLLLFGFTGATPLAFAAAASLLVLVLHDLPASTWVDIARGRAVALARQRHRVFAGVSLGLATALFALTTNVPRLLLGARIGDVAAARFAAITVVFTAASVFTAPIGQVAIPRMARSYAARDRAGFMTQVWTLLLVGAGVGALTVGASAAFGQAVLDALFGPAFAGLTEPLVIVSVAVAVGTVLTFLQDGLTALGVHTPQVAIFGSGVAVVLGTGLVLVPGEGVTGAAISLLAGITTQTVLCIAVFGSARRSRFALGAAG